MYNIVRVEASCSLTKMLIERVVLKSYIVAMIIEMIEINRKQNFNTKNAKKNGKSLQEYKNNVGW